MAILIVLFEFLRNGFYVSLFQNSFWWSLFHTFDNNIFLLYVKRSDFDILNSYTYYTEWLTYFHHSYISHISGDWIFSMPQRNFICKYTWSFMSIHITNVKLPLKYCLFKCQHWLESMSRNTVILNVKTCYTFYISDITVWMRFSQITFYCEM